MADLTQVTQHADPTLTLVLDLLKKDILKSINCHHVGKIKKIDTAVQTAIVEIDYTPNVVDDKPKFIKTAGGSQSQVIKKYPLLIDVPLIILSGGKGRITFPIQENDYCIVLFNDRDIDNWFAGSSNSAVNTDRIHSFSDAIALVGLVPLNSSIDDYSTDRAELIYDGTKISLKDKIKIFNATASLFTILDGVLGVIAALTTTNAVVGAPCLLSPGQITQINNFKAQLGQLLEA